MAKEKFLLIAGCSHATGCEIDGTIDSTYNRSNSFGNLLAHKLSREPINIAFAGSANQGIARTTLEWFSKNYNPDLDLMVLIAWTDSLRTEIPLFRPTYVERENDSSDFFSKIQNHFFRIHPATKGYNDRERRIVETWQNFITEPFAQNYLETLSATFVLNIQYFLEKKQIPYLMCNTQYMFTDNMFSKFYISLIDRSKYVDIDQPDESFYWKYNKLGFKNQSEMYWHHGLEPHRLYSEHLFNFVKNQNIENTGWAPRESNSAPTDYESAALTNMS
jgi:hypothetical protein